MNYNDNDDDDEQSYQFMPFNFFYFAKENYSQLEAYKISQIQYSTIIKAQTKKIDYSSVSERKQKYSIEI